MPDRVWRDSDESRRAFTAVVPGLFYTWAPLNLLGLVMDLAETPLGRAPSAGERADSLAASVFIMVVQLLGVLDY